MAELSTKHPEITAAFHEGKFIVNKINGVFPAFLLTRHMSRIMPLSREMEELLVSLTILVLSDVGW